MLYPDQIPVPPGFARIPWSHVLIDMEVYLIGWRKLDARRVEPAAHGPYHVVDKWWLEDAKGNKVNEIGERLLIRDTTYTSKPPPCMRPPWWKRAWNRMVSTRS